MNYLNSGFSILSVLAIILLFSCNTETVLDSTVIDSNLLERRDGNEISHIANEQFYSWNELSISGKESITSGSISYVYLRFASLENLLHNHEGEETDVHSHIHINGAKSIFLVDDKTLLCKLESDFNFNNVEGLLQIGFINNQIKIRDIESEFLEKLDNNIETFGFAISYPGENTEVFEQAIEPFIETHSHLSRFLPSNVRMIKLGSRTQLNNLIKINQVFTVTHYPHIINNPHNISNKLHYCYGPGTSFGPVYKFVVTDGPGTTWQDHGDDGECVTLTLHIANTHPRFTNSEVEESTMRAAKQWTDAVPGFNINLVSSKKSDNHIQCAFEFNPTSVVGNYSFDGEGGTLAHAFSPQQFRGIPLFAPNWKSDLAGDLHWDAHENWAINTSVHPFTPLEFVTLHELGHSIGLDHSDVPGAVMHEFFSASSATLTSDDISGAQSLFCPPDDCPSGFTFDGANCYSRKYFDMNNHTYFFYDDIFYITPGQNNSCPPGFYFDGLNCSSRLKVPKNLQSEIFFYNSALYIRAQCNC